MSEKNQDRPQCDAVHPSSPQLRTSSAVLVGLGCRLESSSWVGTVAAAPTQIIQTATFTAAEQTVSYISLCLVVQYYNSCNTGNQ